MPVVKERAVNLTYHVTGTLHPWANQTETIERLPLKICKKKQIFPNAGLLGPDLLLGRFFSKEQDYTTPPRGITSIFPSLDAVPW